MKILVIGDVTSPSGIEHLKRNLWKFRKQNKIDFCVVNGENASFITGISPELAEILLRGGADCITGGNHTLRNKKAYNFLDDTDSVLRPVNFGDSAPGKGYTILDSNGYRMLVINAMGRVHIDPVLDSKVVRFPDKTRHQLFLEPMGDGTHEMYLQGFSSSMPSYIQAQMLHSIKGFENAVVMRHAYAIEYDCIDSTQLSAALMFKDIPGLFGAGQFNGTSGYEEAAAQGLIAGINAARFVKGEEPVTLTRNSSYIGTLIDDLVTKGTNEPYRMMTSRSEFRLILRQDNADDRLSEIGYAAGLLPEEKILRFREKKAMIEAEKARLRSVIASPKDGVNELLASVGEPPIKTGVRLSELLKRPNVTYELLAPIDPERKPLPDAVVFTAQTDLKYEGYIKKELADAERFTKLEKRLLPEDICYKNVLGLSTEAAQKLEKFRPISIGAASRISGVSPADISVLLIYLDIKRKERERAAE